MTDMNMSSQDAFGGPRFPHSVNYRGWDMAQAVIGNVLGVAGCAVLGLIPLLRLGQSAPMVSLNLSAVGFSVLLIVAAAYFGWRLWMLRAPILVVYADRIEKTTWNGDLRSLSRDQIKGTRKAGSDRSGSYFEIVPTPDGAKGIRLRSKLRDDPVLAQWLLGTHDLDADALAADRSELMSDARYGASEAERSARLAQAKAIVIAFSVACLAAAVWIFFFPAFDPVHLAAAVLPLLAALLLVRTSDGLIVWLSKGGVRPTAFAGLVPLLALSWKAVSAHMIDGQPLFAAAALAAAASGAMLYLQAPPALRRLAIGAALATGFCVYGLLVSINLALDQSKARIFPVVVQDKRESGSRSRSYDLYVPPWSDRPAGRISVSSDYYDKVSPGSAICLSRRAGALGLGWFDVGDCPPDVSAAAP